MNRRACMALMGMTLLALPVQSQPARVYRVGFLMHGEPQSEDARRFLRAFVEAMSDLGYHDSRNLALAVRNYGSDRGKIPALADELIAWQPDVLVANVSSTAVILQKRTSTIPIVMVTSLDALAEGLVTSLSRPGGNLTGMTSLGKEMNAKLVELVRELLPHAKRFAFLVNPGHVLSQPSEAVAAQAAKRLALEMVTLQVRGAADVEQFAQRLAAARVDALVVATDGVLFVLRDKIVQTALKAGVPSVALLPEFVASGALATYGYDILANYRGAARYVDRIVKGAKPGDLPIEQPTQFELVLNAKTAKALGISIPQPVLVRADKVVE